jgi:hypothetical protein
MPYFSFGVHEDTIFVLLVRGKDQQGAIDRLDKQLKKSGEKNPEINHSFVGMSPLTFNAGIAQIHIPSHLFPGVGHKQEKG